MVILFLTASLEPGKDGVGDYTRRIARECVRMGHECLLIALNDPFLKITSEATDSENGLAFTTLRLPSTLAWTERIKLAKAFRARHAIDWTSLQFVSYGFDRKGIACNLSARLQPLIGESLLHIMFHEIWIGVDPSASFKERIMGRIQRHYIRKLIRRLQPRILTTSNPFYLSLLKTVAPRAGELPLFGNISPADLSTEPGIPGMLVRAGVCDKSGAHPQCWIGLFFGGLYPEWKPEPFMKIFLSACEKEGKRPCLISAGRMGVSGEIVWKKLQKTYSPQINFITLGEQTTRQVSALMRMADFGLAATPWHLLGKSGSVTAMLDHGLPVIVTRCDYRPELPSSESVDPLLIPCDDALESRLLAGLPQRPVRDRAKDVAAHFLHLLAGNSQSV